MRAKSILFPQMLRFFRKHEKAYTDEELVRLYREEGDVDHLGMLYERYIELVYGVCLKYFKSSVKAEDAVMAIFEELVRKLRQHEVRNFKPWLHTLARNHCLMQLRKKEPIRIAFEDMAPSMLAMLVQSAGPAHPHSNASENGQADPLKHCLQQLPPKQLECIRQFYFGEASYKEIAEELSLPLGMVRSHIQNGRRNLRLCLEKKGIKSMDQLTERE
ncbi:MAG: sigma-70 family RNA polymerase sigma factor [Saprospiraceae bacterium]